MAGSNRTQARGAMGSPPPSQSEPASAAQLGARTSYALRQSDHNHQAAPHAQQESRQHDVESRLSEGLEPMHIDDQHFLHDQIQQAAGEVDRLGVHVKDAISTISRLQCLGLQNRNIPLPKVIVLGEQSTGKSSVIEAISGIKTPRSTDTCTRCPLFITLESPADPRAKWHAHVSLRHTFFFDGKNGKGFNRRFPGFEQQDQLTTTPFMSTDDPDKLEHIISRAQSALINPLTDYTEFLKPSIAHLRGDHRIKFSPNVVEISVSHPGLPALSFYDLPGIIGQADSAYEVKFVRDLVIEYVNDEGALILVTCSLANDIANSVAGGIARELKADDRCVGVLTKPDRLPEGTSDTMLRDILEHKKFPLGHGYFVVRNLGQDQIEAGATHQDARTQEQYFFETEEPWSTTLQSHKARFGTYGLQSFLSGKLAEQIVARLPIIQKEIDHRLLAIEADLQQYPKPPTHNASRIIFDIVLEFSQDLRRELEGEWPCKSWNNEWKYQRKAFFDGLISLKPTMATLGNRDQGLFAISISNAFLGGISGRSATDSIVIDEEEREITDTDTQMSETPSTPTKKRKVEGTPVPSPLQTHRSGTKEPSPDFSEKRMKFQLDAVAEYLADSSKTTIPGNTEPRVVHDMMLKSFSNWELPVKAFFDGLEQKLRQLVKRLFDRHFEKWQGTELNGAAWKIVEEMLNLNFHQQRTTMADESLGDEKEGVYIFHAEIFAQEKDTIIQQYRQARFKARFNTYKTERLRRLQKGMSPTEEAKLLRDPKMMALLNREPYSVELDVAAVVTSYYMTAARRFHDSICMRIESKFFRQLRTQLRDELEQGLGIHDEAQGHHTAIRLLAEQSQREQDRRSLVAQKEALLQGRQILEDLRQKNYGNGVQSPGSIHGSFNDSLSSYGIPTPLQDETEEV
ncbi:interferon-induced GTP-binding protein Mx [Paraphoma chrysanthemicola]|uniref:Interferon-induced GTP-binding protein Mx n=1 Tax=Paraphoma chrysanthemicola TaxID=798071 RepID=A0A8K0VTM9_9PLEO|nr:interferon-induced GTP-binding protein Mx [Paraphoma chrysanthemicola]